MKVFSRILTFVIITALLILSFPLSALANQPEEVPQLFISDVTGKAGEKVVIAVEITSNSGLAATDLEIRYDRTKLLYSDYTKGETAEGALLSLNSNFKTEENFKTIRIALAHPEGIYAEGKLVEMTFVVEPGWSGTTTVELKSPEESYDAAYNVVQVLTIGGKVTVEGDGTEEQVTSATQPEKKAEKTEKEVPGKSDDSRLTLILIAVAAAVAVVVILAIVLMKRKK